MTPSHVLGMVSATPYFHFKKKNKSSVSTNLKMKKNPTPMQAPDSVPLHRARAMGQRFLLLLRFPTAKECGLGRWRGVKQRKLQ